jgi:hypothetical protein
VVTTTAIARKQVKSLGHGPQYGGNQANGDGGQEANGNGGDPHAEINEKLGGINDRLDSMSRSQQQAAPSPVQNRMEAFGMGRGSTPAPIASGTQAPPPTLADFAAQRNNMALHQQNVHASFGNARASFNQRAATHAAATPGAVQQTGTGNAMSSAMQENSMSGALGGSPMRPKQWDRAEPKQF